MDLHPKYNDVRTVIEQSPRPEVEAFQIYLDLKYGKSWKLVNVNYIFDLEMCVVQAKKHGGDDFTTFVPFSSSQKWSMHQLTEFFKYIRHPDGSELTSFVLSIVAPDSTTSNYQIYNKLNPPKEENYYT